MPGYFDLLLHCGDWTMMSHSMAAVKDFDAWLGELPGRKVIVPGNHEAYLYEDPSLCSLTPNATILVNEGIEIDGLRIWGSPVTPTGGGAYCVRSAEDRRRIYASIPSGLDILVTHSPPFGILDSFPGGPHQGDAELLEAVQRFRPRMHVFGHIHGGRGITTVDGITYLNAAMLTQHGDLVDRPWLVQMKVT
jgi:Icc-related predicted phosphoesterase